MTQVRIDSSAIVTPRDALTSDRRLKTCPRNVTNTVTNDNSMLLANSANRIEAVSGVSLPPECIARPYLGWTRAITSHIPEKTVEYMDIVKIEIESQLFRLECISCVAGQECIKSVGVSNTQIRYKCINLRSWSS
jgi:hypothetical protein